MRVAAHIFVIAIIGLAISRPVNADDIEIYVPSQCIVDEDYRFIFIVDNSGSMTFDEFDQSKATIDATVSKVLDSFSKVEVAVIQYGSDESGNHDYHVTIPFTSDKSTALSWQRAFGTGGIYKPTYWQDHQPGSLAKMRRDNVYDPGGALDITTGSNLQFVFFSDGERDLAGVCCSSLVAENTDFAPVSTVHPMFGEYDKLKDGSVLPGGLKAQFTMLHVAYTTEARNAGAAIASVGGDYTGPIESNPGDPDSGVGPRRYLEGSFSESDTTKILDLITEVIEEIRFPSETESFTDLTITVNKNTGRSDNRVFMSLFQPSIDRAWAGNFKGYFLGAAGLVDTNGQAATEDSDIGLVFSDTAQSFWSSQPDGNIVIDGGSAEQLPGSRNLYSNINASATLYNSDNQLKSVNTNITNSMLGVASDAERVSALDWVQSSGIGDALHSKPEIVRYANKTLMFGMTNQGFLHAIDASSPTAQSDHSGGTEIWAFMPQELLVNLPQLSSESAVGEHIYGLDGAMTRWHDDANNDGIVNGSEKVILVLGMRRGGKSYYALDVTDPDFPKLKWIITGGVTTGFDDLAQTWSKMSLIRVKRTGMSATSVTEANTDQVLIFGGGYEGEVLDDRTQRLTAKGGAIYMIDRDGTLLWKTEDLLEYSIPSDLAVIDSDSDGLADRIYAPDLGGQIWRVDFDNVNASTDFSVHRFASLGESSFQPFFYPPSIALSSRSKDGYFTVSIGSGNRDNPLDTTSRNKFYMLKDTDVSVGPPADPNSDISESDLYDVTNNKLGSSDAAVVAAASEVYSMADGWMLKLEPGEKALSKLLNFNGMFIATTYLPSSADPNDVQCTDDVLSESRLYIIDTITGVPISNDFSTIPNETTGLTSADRHKVIGRTGIPGTPVIAFPEGSDGAQLLVGKEAISTISLHLTKRWWHVRK